MIFTYAKGFRLLGHQTYTVVLSKKLDYYPDSAYDVVLEERLGNLKAKALSSGFWSVGLALVRTWVLSLALFLKALVTCDLFIFVWGSPSLLPRHWDYPILKMFGKAIVAVFLGSDIRYWYAFQQEVRLLGLYHEFKPYLEYLKSIRNGYFDKIEEVRAAERYADVIFSQPDCGQLQTRPYMRTYLPLDLAQYRFHVPDREVPIVLHAPSNPRAKGTKYVLEAVEQLRREGIKFEFVLIEQMPNARLRQLLTDADIVVDQLFGLTIATLALESMATGNVVLANLEASYSHVPSDCPVVKVTMDTLADQLGKVILDRDLRRRLACVGRKYVEKYHPHLRVAQQVLDCAKARANVEYDFFPTFFKNHFVMPDELVKEERVRRMQKQRRRLLPARLRWIVWPFTLVP